MVAGSAVVVAGAEDRRGWDGALVNKTQMERRCGQVRVVEEAVSGLSPLLRRNLQMRGPVLFFG
jgi:hypothetical protein